MKSKRTDVRSEARDMSIPVRRRLRELMLGAAVALCILPAPEAHAEALKDEQLAPLMISTVVVHDIGVLAGFVPWPVVVAVAGEATAYAANIGLKAYRPWLRPWKNGEFNNLGFFPEDDDDKDPCSFHFYLPNSQGDYSNMFGIIPLRPPYYDPHKNREYRWGTFGEGPTRWGELAPPRLYHANSTARLSVRSRSPVRRFDETIGAFMRFDVPYTDPPEKTMYYYPIVDAYSPCLDEDGKPKPCPVPRVYGVAQPNGVDQDGQPAPTHLSEDVTWQEVYLPIGAHTLEWSAATRLNSFTDVLVPGLLLASMVYSEIKAGKQSINAAKKAKAARKDPSKFTDGSGTDKDASDALKSKEKFDAIWKGWITKKDTDGPPKPLKKQVREKLASGFTKKVLCPLIDRLRDHGVSILEEETVEALKRSGKLTIPESKLIKLVYQVAKKEGLSLATDALKQRLLGEVGLSEAPPSGLIDNPSGGLNKKQSFAVLVLVEVLNVLDLNQYVEFDTGVSTIGQRVRVWDTEPPEWIAPAPAVYLEATAFGGTPKSRVMRELRLDASRRVSDKCGRVPILASDVPTFLSLGQHDVTWTAYDPVGSNPPPCDTFEAEGCERYRPTSTQTIIVEDTQPPLLLAPPSKVIEATTARSLNQADIGTAVAVDLADIQPEITAELADHLLNDTDPDDPVFALDQRSVVHWTATDKSGNAAHAEQLITVKTEGTNTQPVAYGTSGATLTAAPVSITLTGKDFDVLGGRADPLWFKIEAHPQRGEFIAPLLPFFIEDYRTKPGDGLGHNYDPNRDLGGYLTGNYCNHGMEPPKSFVHQPSFVQVTDDGIRYVLDEFYHCDNSGEFRRRFSKWNAAGGFLGQIRLGPNGEDWPLGGTFVLDRDGSLYYSTRVGGGTGSDELILWKCATAFVDIDQPRACDEVARFKNDSAPDDAAFDISRVAYARVDSNASVVYVADNRSVFAFGPPYVGSGSYLGELGPMENNAVLEDWFDGTTALEVGSDGSLYVADTGYHRIHKIAPITVDIEGKFVLGDYIGWAGACKSSGNKACDEANGRSRGYSCTFESDSCVPTEDGSGEGQGQFHTPKYIAIDPNDVLYIADYENARVQRLSPDGSFAGEAGSTGTGFNTGDRPSFVLGNMGKPASVSVNSSQFYVVDVTSGEPFVHVFGALPFEDITDNEATVRYVSDQDFPNPYNSDVDVFTFSVSDGLAVSDPATVSVTVSRNFRPPVASEGLFPTDEDLAFVFELLADDPDGIIGKDFLGLDTLTYTVTAKPEHGELSGSDACGEDAPDGACLTYKPDPDFYGDDLLRFKVNDGRDDSNEATVTITVEPVNDPPVLTIEVPERVALGFPTLVTSSFTDDPSEFFPDEDPPKRWKAAASWGDGQVSEAGEFGEDDDGDPHIYGVVVSEPPMPGLEGRTFANHTYESLGLTTVRICVTDSGMLYDCKSAEINVEELVSLAIGGRVYTEPLPDRETLVEVDDDEDFTYELTIVNQLPSVGDGLPAEEVVLEAELPNLMFGAIESSHGTCTLTDSGLICNLADLDPGDRVTVTIEAFGPGNLSCNEDFDINATLTTRSEALQNEMEFLLSVELLGADGDCDLGPPGGGGCSCRVADSSDYDTCFVLLVLAFGAWYRRRHRAGR